MSGQKVYPRDGEQDISKALALYESQRLPRTTQAEMVP